MAFRHASRRSEYRTPFGAMPTDGRVLLYLDTDKEADNVTLCYTYGLYDFSYQEEPMCHVKDYEDRKRYEVRLALPHEPGLLFYWFKFNMPSESGSVTRFYVAEGDTPDGSGRLSEEPPRVGPEEDKYPYAFQITVYQRGYRTPDHMKGAMIYQIFPDRFARDSEFSFKELINASPREERIYHEDWYEDVDIKGKPSTGYLACDFFGGSLRGITEHLDYIKSLGIDIIYLNPIFEARSSHRYDTADYLNVDPILGGNEAFDELSRKASELGIKLIIDGVFSHTGADSRYFNKFDRYSGVGAYRSYKTGEESKFRSWYSFYRDDEGNISYESWWGFPDLPNVDENNLSYRNFIFGEGGVVDTWTSRGAAGIRLDVSDELPDSFIRQMRDTLKAKTDGQGMLVGEVWEDASNKCSYGSYRDFLFGRTHDSVMGYTFRSTVLDFLCGYIDASVFNSRLEGYRERYPAESYYCIMNLISSHDVPRAMTLLALPEVGEEREEQQKLKVPEELVDDCARLMQMAYAIQIGYIGACCVYYGDEVLMEGYKDPFNRRTYPWGRLNGRQEENLELVRRLAALRSENDVLKTGFYETLYAEGQAMAFRRFADSCGKDFFDNKIENGSSNILLLLNRSADILYFDVKDGKQVSLSENGDVPLAVEPVTKAVPGAMQIGLPPSSFIFVVY